MIETIRPIILLVATSALLFAMASDVALRTIPNTLCAILTVLALGLRAEAGDMVGALIATTIVFLLATFCWTRGWLGGGDVKLLTASVLLVSPAHVPTLLLDTAMAGGVLAVAYLILSRVVPVPRWQPATPLLGRIWRAERWRISRRFSMPYACAIGAGAFFTLLNG